METDVAKLGVIQITEDERSDIRVYVREVCNAWLNDGADYEPRELLKRAFGIIRRRMFDGRGTLDGALGDLQIEISRYEDM